MSTKRTIISDFDLDTVLKLIAPQTLALAGHEHVSPMLRHGARAMVASPSYALEMLGPKAIGKLGRALDALGQQHQAVAERMLEMEAAAGRKSAQPKASCGSDTGGRDG